MVLKVQGNLITINSLTFANHFQYIKNTNILCQMFLQVTYIYAIDLRRPFICT
jgi:hypothetical protein